MDFEKILAYLKAIWEAIKGFLEVPNPNDEVAVRAFVIDFLGWCQPLARWTKGEWDDRVLKTILEIVGNNDAWAIIWANRTETLPLADVTLRGLVAADSELAAKFGLSLGDLIELIQAIIKFLRAIGIFK